jgi:hypothetical protein
MKQGQQVRLRFHTEITGTVSAVTKDRVLITWPRRWATMDNSQGGDKMVHLPRQRTWHLISEAMKVLEFA